MHALNTATRQSHYKKKLRIQQNNKNVSQFEPTQSDSITQNIRVNPDRTRPDTGNRIDNTHHLITIRPDANPKFDINYDSLCYARLLLMEGHTFGQRRPPLSVTIKSILSRYPDGQIFKVWLYAPGHLTLFATLFFRSTGDHSKCRRRGCSSGPLLSGPSPART